MGYRQNGKTTDSDSVISRFESCSPALKYLRQNVWDIFCYMENCLEIPGIAKAEMQKTVFVSRDWKNEIFF